MSSTLVEKIRESLEHARNSEANRMYYINEARDQLRLITQYIQSLEDANAAMMEEIRRNRKK